MYMYTHTYIHLSGSPFPVAGYHQMVNAGLVLIPTSLLLQLGLYSILNPPPLQPPSQRCFMYTLLLPAHTQNIPNHKKIPRKKDFLGQENLLCWLFCFCWRISKINSWGGRKARVIMRGGAGFVFFSRKARKDMHTNSRAVCLSCEIQL